MKYEPLYDRLIVKLMQPDDRTAGGLYIPQMAHEGTPYMTAEVMAVGQGRITSSGSTVPLLVKVGEVVVFFRSQSSGEQMMVPTRDGTEQMIIREANIAWIVRDLDKVSTLTAIDGSPMVLPS